MDFWLRIPNRSKTLPGGRPALNRNPWADVINSQSPGKKGPGCSVHTKKKLMVNTDHGLYWASLEMYPDDVFCVWTLGRRDVPIIVDPKQLPSQHRSSKTFYQQSKFRLA